MDMRVLKEVLKRRRAKDFDTKKFLESESLKANTEVVLGEGPNESDMAKVKGGNSLSSDDLAPNAKEMEMEGVEGAKDLKPFSDIKKGDFGEMSRSGEELKDVSDTGGSADDLVFDEREYKRAKGKKKMNLTERMQFSLGEKLRK